MTRPPRQHPSGSNHSILKMSSVELSHVRHERDRQPRAPDARDGLKPSQRRILVAMNDLHLGPATQRAKCRQDLRRHQRQLSPARRRGHLSDFGPSRPALGDRDVLIDKQGNFGSPAGLPPAAMRYTEARLSAIAVEMLDDLNHETVDYVDNYTRSSKSRSSFRHGFPTCSSTARAASPWVWRPAFRRTI